MIRKKELIICPRCGYGINEDAVCDESFSIKGPDMYDCQGCSHSVYESYPYCFECSPEAEGFGDHDGTISRCIDCGENYPTRSAPRRVEYSEMIHHSNGAIEIRTSATPDMANAESDWYKFKDGIGPMPLDNQTRIDAIFNELTEGIL